MVNFKLGKEIRKDAIIMSRTWDKGKKKPQTGVRKVIGSIPVGDSVLFLVFLLVKREATSDSILYTAQLLENLPSLYLQRLNLIIVPVSSL